MYETVFICNPDLSSEELTNIIEKVRNVISSNNGDVKAVKHLGKKKLAYPIKKNQYGNYICVEFKAEGKCIEKLENFYRLSRDIIRFLTVNLKRKEVK